MSSWLYDVAFPVLGVWVLIVAWWWKVLTWGISETDVFVVSSYCEIRFGVVVGRDILVVALCLVCLWSILVFL